MATDPLERVREICLALPDTRETLTWDSPYFRVGDKIFAGYGDTDITEQVVALGQQQQPFPDALKAGSVEAPMHAAVSVDLGDVVHRVRHRRGPFGGQVLLAHGSPSTQPSNATHSLPKLVEKPVI